MEKTTGRIQFRTVEGLHAEVLKRAGGEGRLNEIARRDLQRYYQVLNDAYAILSRKMSVAEQYAIFEVCREKKLPPEQGIHALPWLRIWLEKAIQEGMLDKWMIEADKLKSVVHDLSTVEALSLIDAAENWWALSPDQRMYNAQCLLHSGELVQTHFEVIQNLE